VDDAERYNAEFDRLMRYTEVQAEHARSRDREAIWKALAKSFNQLCCEQEISAGSFLGLIPFKQFRTLSLFA
jgi:hypothetical protein